MALCFAVVLCLPGTDNVKPRVGESGSWRYQPRDWVAHTSVLNMAEAAAATRFTVDSARGAKLAYDRNGLHIDLSFTIPPPLQALSACRRSVRRSYFSLRDALL